MKNMKNKDAVSRRKLRLGGYSIALICIVLAMLVAVNLIVGALPTKYTHIDVTHNQLYSLSEDTIEYLNTIDKDVTMYLVTANGTENNDIYEILSKYEAESKNLRVVVKDPTLYPNFVSQYTMDALGESSIIVECGENYKIVNSGDLFALDYETYYATGAQEYTYAGESLITAAITNVTSEVSPKLYTLSGHDEILISDAMTKAIENKNYVIESLNLLSAGAVPEDCDMVLINAPSKDISDEEATLLLDYMENGGNVILFTIAGVSELPNLLSVTEAYGLTMQSGVVLEGASNRQYGNNRLYPVANKLNHDITGRQIAEDTTTIMPISHGITILDQYRSTIDIEPLLETSDESYLKEDPSSMETQEKEDGDIDGPFYLGVTAEEIYNDTQTRLVWYSCAYMEYYDQITNSANTNLILSSLDWLYGEESVGMNIPEKSMTSQTMAMTASQTLLWVGIMIILIPVALLVFGLVYWLKRRKR